MSYNGPSGIGECEALKISLLAYNMVNNTSTNITRPFGLLQFMLSPWNDPYLLKVSMEQLLKKFKLTRLTRGTAALASRSINCDPADTKNYVDNEIDPAEYAQAQASFRVDLSLLQLYCSDFYDVINLTDSAFFTASRENRNAMLGDSQFMGNLAMNMESSGFRFSRHFVDLINKLMSQMHSIRANINQQLAEMLVAMAGVNAYTGNALPTPITVIKTDDAVAQTGFTRLTQQFFTANQMEGPMAILGTGNVEIMNIGLAYGCCNCNGFNLQEMAANADWRFFRDLDIPAAAGNPNYFSVLSPGMTQLVYRNNILALKNQALAQPVSSVNYGLLPDPMIPGLVYDMRITDQHCVDNNPEKIVKDVYLSLNFDLIPTPAFAFDITDTLYGVNGIFAYEGLQAP